MCARTAWHGIWTPCSRRFEAAAADLARRQCRRALADGVGWSAPRVGRKDNHAESLSTRVLRGRSTVSLRREARAGRTAQKLNATATAFRSRSRRPVAVSVKRSLGQWCGVERAPRWPRRQPRQVRQRTRAWWAIGRFSTDRTALGPRDTGFQYCGQVAPKPQPLIWRSLGEQEPRLTTWDGARPALATKTTTPSPPVRAYSVGGRPVLHGAQRARAARLGIQRM